MHGKPETYIGVKQDITDRIEAEAQLRLSQALAMQAQTVAHLGTVEWDLRSNDIHWSDEVYRILGVAPGTSPPPIGGALAFVHRDDRERWQDANASAIEVRLAGESSAVSLEIRDDGDGFDIARQASPNGQDGYHLGLIGMRERCEMFGGALELSSVHGQGTTVRVRMPLRADDASLTGRPDGPNEGPPGGRH